MLRVGYSCIQFSETLYTSTDQKEQMLLRSRVCVSHMGAASGIRFRNPSHVPKPKNSRPPLRGAHRFRDVGICAASLNLAIRGQGRICKGRVSQRFGWNEWVAGFLW
jgi:hypothetical protein